MPTLHVRITDGAQNHTISRIIHAQNFQLARGTIVKSNASTPLNGVSCKVNFLNGVEVISTTARDDTLHIPFVGTGTVSSTQFDKGYMFTNEHIPNQFDTEVYDDHWNAISFGQSGVQYIDLFFNYDETYEYE